MERKKEYVIYLTAEKGNGKVIEYARLESMAEFEFPLWMFDKDCVLSIDEVWEPEIV